MQKYHLTLLLQRWSFEIRKLEFMFSRLLVTLWLDFLLSEALKFIEKKTQQFDSIILDEKYLEKSGSNRSTLFNSISFVTVSNKEEFAETESIQSWIWQWFRRVGEWFSGCCYFNVFEKHLDGKTNSAPEIGRKFPKIKHCWRQQKMFMSILNTCKSCYIGFLYSLKKLWIAIINSKTKSLNKQEI